MLERLAVLELQNVVEILVSVAVRGVLVVMTVVVMVVFVVVSEVVRRTGRRRSRGFSRLVSAVTGLDLLLPILKMSRKLGVEDFD